MKITNVGTTHETEYKALSTLVEGLHRRQDSK
jgi:hypothetical protein